ncbi:MAG: peptidylprolyl isomerase [Ignavibacteria bacterium]|nr:peptidylprolyl isomerase [Ignavibacteria bacterium]
MKRQKTLILLLVISIVSTIFFAYGCNNKNKTVVAEVGNDKVLMYEFENQFLKILGNNLDSAKKTTLEQRKDFLDLMIKLRLKVLDATEKGYLESQEIKTDLDNYKKNYISAFLIDRKVVDPQIKELYERKKFEVRASHILINLPQTATPEDSIKAYQKAQTVIDRLKNGENFGTVAAEMSDDPSAKQNGGDLYYFTAGMTVPEFEDAIYKMSVGDYTKKPVRTMFGLHIVKLVDKKKRNDGIRASHILIQDVKDSLGRVIDSLASFNKIQEVYAKLKNGEDFGKLASEYSQDPGSAPKGGDLGFFDRRRMVQPFDSAAFMLKVGEYSTPVKTPYGYHIIKVTEIKQYQDFDKAKDGLKNDFKRSPLYKTEYDKYIDKALKDYDLTLDKNGIALLFSKVDSSKTIGNIMFDSLFNDAEKGTKLATYKGGFVTLLDVVQLLQTSRDMTSSVANLASFTKIIQEVAKTPVLNAVAQKENIDKDEEYLDLLKEYTAGLLREKIDLEQISSKIKINDEDIQKYYDSHIAQYKFKDGDTEKVRPIEEAKSEITNILRQEKFSETEKAYIENLKQKYPVKVNADALNKAFNK